MANTFKAAAASHEKIKAILTSKQVTLIPGAHKSSLKIHKQLLVSVSPTLAKNFGNDWESLSEQVLICFITWAYLGDYSTETVGISSYVEQRPISKKKKKQNYQRFGSWQISQQAAEYEPWQIPPVAEAPWVETEVPPEEEPAAEDPPPPVEEPAVGEPATGSLTASEPAEHGTLKSGDANSPSSIDSRLAEHEFLGSGSSNSPSTTSQATASAESSHPLLLHIKMYAFAGKYFIDDLSFIVKQKIIAYLRELEEARDETENIDKIFDMLDHAVESLAPDDYLLDWLAMYSGWKLNILKKDTGRLDALLELEKGVFAKLLFKHVAPGQRTPFIIF